MRERERETETVCVCHRSQARAAIGYSYGREGETVSQAQRDEQLLAEYLGEDEEDDDNKSSSDSEFGQSQNTSTKVSQFVCSKISLLLKQATSLSSNLFLNPLVLS